MDPFVADLGGAGEKVFIGLAKIFEPICRAFTATTNNIRRRLLGNYLAYA